MFCRTEESGFGSSDGEGHFWSGGGAGRVANGQELPPPGSNARGIEFSRRHKVWERGRPWKLGPVVKGADFGSYRFASHKYIGDRNRVAHLVPEPRAEWWVVGALAVGQEPTGPDWM